MLFKSLRKTFLSIVLLGATATSVNALQVTENYIINTYVGVGGFYNTSNGDNAKLSFMGPYLSFGGYDVYAGRLGAGMDFKVGYGHNQVSFNNKPNASSIYLEAMLNFGINVLSVNAPLFINIILGYDNQFTIRNKAVGRHLLFVGAELDGKIPFGSNMKLTYGGGYSYVSTGGYNIDNSPDEISSGNIFHAKLGVLMDINENIAFYAKAIGKYYTLPSAEIFPKSNVWSGNLEFGVVF